MMTFTPSTLENLKAMYAALAEGEMVLHHIPGKVLNPNAPACFRRFDSMGYLMSTNKEALEAAARDAGVKRGRVERKRRGGLIYFTTYLYGLPLEKLIHGTKPRKQPAIRTIRGAVWRVG